MGIKFAPELKAKPVAAVKRGRGRPASGKDRVTIRLDPDVIAKFKATGDGWQSRMNEALRAAKV